jgi:hypothetical protein
MDEKKKEIAAILRRAEEALQTARHGYSDLTGANRDRRFTGLRNLITFGRSVTWVLQNLRSVIRAEFDQWYEAKQKQMESDPLMRYFVKARNELEKLGKLSVSTVVNIHSFAPSLDLKKFGPPPPGAVGFFVGDQCGGTGWEVAMPDGTKEKYYVELPAEIGEVKQYFANFPETREPELDGKSVEELSDIYLARLEAILIEAREHFQAS